MKRTLDQGIADFFREEVEAVAPRTMGRRRSAARAASARAAWATWAAVLAAAWTLPLVAAANPPAAGPARLRAVALGFEVLASDEGLRSSAGGYLAGAAIGAGEFFLKE